MASHLLPCWVWLLAIAFLSPVNAQSMQVTLPPLEEEKPAQTFVGNIARATSISSEVSQAVFNTLRFEFLDPNNVDSHLFSIDKKSGAIYTKTSIDRETACEDLEECLIRFDVTVSSEYTSYLRLVDVTVNITDKNDNVPKFRKQSITVNIPENNAPGWSKPLPTAIDKDTHKFSVQDYRLLTSQVPFSLHTERRLNNKFSISLRVNKMLDREARSYYTLRIIATDGGPQALTGTMTVHVNVTDANDNSPRFTQPDYSFSVKETFKEGSVLGSVTAHDRDAGGNGDVRYAINFPSRDTRGPELFDIDNYSGEITIKSALQDDAGRTFHAVVEARDQGEVTNVADATLTITVLNVENNAPKLDLKLLDSGSVTPRTVIISEDAKLNKFVGKLTATDNDPGASGQVVCESRHPCFKTVDFGGYFTVRLNGSLDREKDPTIDVPLVCHDGGRPSKTSSITFRVMVGDVNDNPPVFSKIIYVVNVTEEDVIGKPILQLTAEDPDSGINKHFTYSLFPVENKVFLIDPEKGILKARNTFDHEVEKKLNVIVKAVDKGLRPKTGTATVIVNIVDINDNYPMLLTQTIHVPENIGRMRQVGYLVGNDKDSGRNSELVFSMPPSDNNNDEVFRVNPDGTILALQDLDRETQDHYLLAIEVRDRGFEPKRQSSTVTVIIDDVNDNVPVFQFPSPRNQSIVIMWSTPPNRQIVWVNATDKDLGRNGSIAYYIKEGNQAGLFAVDKDSGVLALRRRIRASDDQVHHLQIAAHDWGVVQQESQQLLRVVVDVTNATFAALEDDPIEERYTLIAGVVAGVTLLLSVIILVIIFLVRRGNDRRPPPPVEKHMEWHVVKAGVQEECGKGMVEKIPVWRGSDEEIDSRDDDGESGKGGSNFSPGSPPDVTKIGNDVTFKKTMSPNATWHDGRDGFIQSHTIGIGLDPYRKQDFYTFCKVRNAHDDVNSVTSGETATSDSGRGGSEDDIPLPPIAEYSPELNSNQGSPKHMTEYRPITTLSPAGTSRHPSKSDYKTMPSLSSFKSLDAKAHALQGDSSLNAATLPYNTFNSDKVHPSSRPNHGYTSLAQVPGKSAGGQGRHVTFSNANRGMAGSSSFVGRDDPNYDSSSSSRRSPYGSAGYENFIPEAGGLYVSLPRCQDDDDGNTTTSGSYTIDSDNLNDSIISA